MWLWLVGCTAVEKGVDVPPLETPAPLTDTPEETDTAVPTIEVWDSSPPEVPLGSVMATVTYCALLTEYGAPLHWTYMGDTEEGQLWQLVIEPGMPDVRPELQVCVSDAALDFMYWKSAELMHIVTGGLEHYMTPAVPVNRWMGEVAPLDVLDTPECDDAIASLGLSWPVTMQVEIVEIVPP